MKAARGQRGHLLIEFAVAAAVATAAVSATIATVISTAKSGREIEVLTQAVSDTTMFAEYESLLHQMGGPNSNYTVPGDLAADYVAWINQNYPILPNALNPIQSTTFIQNGGFGAVVTNGILAVGNLGNAYGYPVTAAPGTYAWSAADTATSPMQMNVTYAHAQAFVGLGVAQLTAGVLTAPSNDNSVAAEAVIVFVSEDPGTGIVSVSPYYQFGSVDFTAATGGNNPIAAGGDLSAAGVFTNNTLTNTAGSATLPSASNVLVAPGPF